MNHIFELVDVTDEERYYTLGLFTNMEWAVREALRYDPSMWDNKVEDCAVCEIRRRAIGLSGQDYAVEWRCEWTSDTSDWMNAWVHAEPQRATLNKPLPMCRL